MGSISDDNLKVPFIDFSEATEPGAAGWADVRAEVRKALDEFGCFEARFSRVPLDLRNGTLGALNELFELPLETKLRNSSTKPLHGYIGQYPEYPLYESLGIDDADVLEKLDTFTNTFWPEGHPDFSKTLHSCSEKLSELDKIIRRMILESFGAEKYMEELFNSTNYLLRVMKYGTGPETADAKLGLGTHTDKSFVTILFQNNDGLELETKDGKWINLKASSPESFIVMIGDSFRVWANGRLHSPYHRVMINGNEERFSVGLFSTPIAGSIINAPEELVDDEHPRLYKPFDYVKFTQFNTSGGGERANAEQEAYLLAFKELSNVV